MSDAQAECLVGKFLDGSTTIEEERRLYDYFKQKHVASDLECYRGMFMWYDSLEADPVENKGSIRRTRIFASAAAVAMLLLVGAGVIIGSAAKTDAYSIERRYAGSYIIRNGEKITDIREILPELQRADRLVDSTLMSINAVSCDDADRILIDEALKNITDPEVKAILLADLN